MDSIQAIVQIAKKGMKRLNVLAIIGILIGIALGPLVIYISYVPSIMREMDMDPKTIRIIGIIFSLIFAGAILEQIVKQFRDRKILRVITTEPQKLAWIYTQVTTGSVRVMGPGIKVGTYFHVFFFLTDKSSSKVWLKQDDANRLMEMLMEQFHDVTFGYSDEIRKLYRENPLNLKMNPQRISQEKVSHISSRA